MAGNDTVDDGGSDEHTASPWSSVRVYDDYYVSCEQANNCKSESAVVTVDAIVVLVELQFVESFGSKQENSAEAHTDMGKQAPPDTQYS